ncbi:DUF4349 domain-containing protein [Salinirussus salinus]|uniref:DUF4349 domain-containing protein n=1 Tax=Salinirussus salinus TaxID=1198300 RepID=UPI00135BB569|nr:DUF4349 domain-containing protein [Salinirussus salinus]
MDRTRGLATVALVALVVLAGCGSLGGGGGAANAGDGGGGGADGADGPAGGDAGAEAGGGDAVAGQAQVDRAVIRTGTVELRVGDFEAARSAVADRARSLGGYVSESGSTRNTRDNRSWTTGYVVVRVPAERFSDALADARERGTVLSEGTETEDVTDQLVDLEARLTNLRERRDRLRSFYDRANSTEELLRVEERLSSVQSEIERLEAERRALENRVAFSTLRVELREPEPGADAEDDAGSSPVSAFLGSVGALGDLLYGAVLLAARLGPFVLFGGAVLAAGLVARRAVGGRPPWRTDDPAAGGSGPPRDGDPGDERDPSEGEGAPADEETGE